MFHAVLAQRLASDLSEPAAHSTGTLQQHGLGQLLPRCTVPSAVPTQLLMAPAAKQVLLDLGVKPLFLF